MTSPFLGEIIIFGGNFAPRGFAFCNGQLLSISQNAALFAILGTTYGGDGRVNFGLPDLQGRVPIHFGNGVGLSPYVLGEIGGVENVSLLQNQMPQHNHNIVASDGPASATRPLGSVPGKSSQSAYAASPDGTLMNAGMVSAAGGSLPHPNLQPYLALNFCIALVGVFPSRN